ncbi:MAG: site-specific DNA-methyltransferase [Deltaproteobacteria bacterium]|nr:site-specific DNA-methyltransferase [Deltaproteobacteria bacterium]
MAKAGENKLIFGDCLDVMLGADDRGRLYIPDGSVDLVYLDPPFNSKANYNMIFGKGRDKQAQMTAFTDTWQWGGQGTQDVAEIEGAVGHPAHRAIKGIYYTLGECGLMAYLGYMAKRLAVVHSKMKDTASIYLHCDPTASHYLKVVMDGIFDAQSFRNEISWKRRSDIHNLAKKHMGKAHDIILYYGKSDKATYRRQFLDYSEEYISTHYKHKDKKGYYRILPCTNESGGNKPYEFEGVTRSWRFEPKRMKQMLKENLLVQLSTGGPFYYKKYIKDAKGVPLQDIWLDIAPARGNESLGYPTQKPLALLERIIQASSNPGELVLDPFCGCGTTIAAAENLGRRWIGIDISAATIRIVAASRPELQMAKYDIFGIPKGMEEARKLAQLNRLQYEHWAISTIPGLAPNDRRNQEGFDGIGSFNEPIPDGRGKVTKQTVTAEVKSSKGGVTAAQRSHLKNHTGSNNSQLGIFLTLDRDPATEKWCNQQGHYQLPGSATKYPRFQVFSAEQYFAGDHPNLPPLLDPMTGKPLQIPLPAP